jgi:hypothetical protein
MTCSCGVGSYEAAMARTRERLAYVDRADRLLGEPVTMPTGQRPALFLRPPKGIQSVAKGEAIAEWLTCFPWSDAKTLVPPLELLVGVHPRTEREELDTLIARDLRTKGAPLQRPTDASSGRDVVVHQDNNVVGDGSAIRFRRLLLHAEEAPGGPAPRRGVASNPCIYRYEALIHEPDEWCIVVIFKQLDRDATERLWKAQGVDPAEIRRLPVIERKEWAQQREFCLASLRVGEAAEARWKSWHGE